MTLTELLKILNEHNVTQFKAETVAGLGPLSITFRAPAAAPESFSLPAEAKPDAEDPDLFLHVGG